MKIFIDKYKNIENITLVVPQSRKMILLGTNGVGKTNILEAIYSGNCRFSETHDYADCFLLSFDALTGKKEYFPNEKLLKSYFTARKEKAFVTLLMDYLKQSYRTTEKPLLKKMISDALESISYAAENRRFDPSPLAITRLVILSRIYQLVQEKKEKYIILVDSPELFAHPVLIEELTALLQQLQAAGCLIILSTHSDQVISRLFTGFDEIIKVSKNQQGKMEVLCPDIDSIIANIRDFYSSDEYLTHNFSKATHVDEGMITLLENDVESFLITAFRDHIITAFFSDVIVLGEGASEGVLFDYIDNVLHPAWVSEKQVGFISCLGKSTMPLYFIFLNGIGVKTFVLYDYDNDLNQVHVAYHHSFYRYFRENRKMFRSYYLKPDLEGVLNIGSEKRIPSLIKPVNIFNYTFLQPRKNKSVDYLLQIIRENISAFFQVKK